MVRWSLLVVQCSPAGCSTCLVVVVVVVVLVSVAASPPPCTTTSARASLESGSFTRGLGPLGYRFPLGSLQDIDLPTTVPTFFPLPALTLLVFTVLDGSLGPPRQPVTISASPIPLLLSPSTLGRLFHPLSLLLLAFSSFLYTLSVANDLNTAHPLRHYSLAIDVTPEDGD